MTILPLYLSGVKLRAVSITFGACLHRHKYKTLYIGAIDFYKCVCKRINILSQIETISFLSSGRINQ
jgi:hypothetical protein